MGKGHAKARARFFAGAALQEAESAKQDVRSSEDIYGQVTSLLGAEGTYPGSPGYQGPTIGGPTPPGGSLFDETGTVSKMALAQNKGQHQAGAAAAYGEMAKGINVGKAVQQITGSKSFQIASQLTAESQQLLNREGPLYERMQKSITNPILKRGSQMMEDSLEELKSTYARGGRARREGMKDAMKMQAQMEANEFVGSKMVEANTNFDNWARENARSTLAFNQAWASNLQGVRNQYTGAMAAARGYMLQSGIPTASALQAQADAINQQGKKNWVDIGIGAVAAVAGVVTANPGLIGMGVSKAASGMSSGGGMTLSGGGAGSGGASSMSGGGMVYGGTGPWNK